MDSGLALEAFSSGSSPSNAIKITDDGDIGNPGEFDLEKLLEVNNAVAIEKEIAADTLGTLFAATRTHYLPYVEQSALELVKLLPHFYEGIRKSALESLLEIVRTFYKLNNPPEWEAGTDNVRPFKLCIPLFELMCSTRPNPSRDLLKS